MKLPRPRKVFRYLIYFVALLIIIFYCILPCGVALIVSNAPHAKVDAPPDGFSEVPLTTSDDVVLAGWYAPPQNGAAIILLHGASGSRNSVRKQATMLLENGYGILALDLHGHGESQGKTNLFGWNGSQDVAAAVEYLQMQPDVEVIGGLGVSLGGEALLGAASENPAVRAIVADGATYRSYDEFRAVPDSETFLGNLQFRMQFFYVGLFTGDSPPLPIAESIADSDAQFYLIAAGKVENEEVYNKHFVEVAKGRAELWVAPEVGHTGAFGKYPDEYEERIIGFFNKNLLNQ